MQGTILRAANPKEQQDLAKILADERKRQVVDARQAYRYQMAWTRGWDESCGMAGTPGPAAQAVLVADQLQGMPLTQSALEANEPAIEPAKQAEAAPAVEGAMGDGRVGGLDGVTADVPQDVLLDALLTTVLAAVGVHASWHVVAYVAAVAARLRNGNSLD